MNFTSGSILYDIIGMYTKYKQYKTFMPEKKHRQPLISPILQIGIECILLI